MSNIDKKLVVLIPAFNESENIAGVISQIPREIPGIFSVQILVINDGSTDDTASQAHLAGADNIINNPKNLGLGKTFSLGLEQALFMDADIIVNIDGDGQFDPRDIPRLIQPIIKQRADMVTGSRFLQKEKIKNLTWIKKIGNLAFTKLICSIIKQKLTDTQCGFRAYSKETALKLNLFGKFSYTQEVFINLANKDITIAEIPITVKYFDKRKSKISGNLILYGFRSLGIIANTTRDTQPISFFGLPGFILFTLGCVSGLYSFIYWLIYLKTTPVKTLVTVAIFLMLSGLLLIIFGLLADMIKRSKQTQEEILYRLKKQELIKYKR